MTITHIDDSQRKAAKVAGLAYLLAIPIAIFAEFYVSGQLIYNNSEGTRQNIIAHEQLFRLGIASNLTVFALDVVLITALFIVLNRVNLNLVLLAVFWRLIETSILVVTLLNDFDALRVFSSVDYLQAFEAGQLQVMAQLSFGAHGTGYKVGLLFAGLGSTIFCYIWYRSNFIPKSLALLGVFSSLFLTLCMYAFIIFPDFGKNVTVVYYGAPIFVFELSMGFWLLIKGIEGSAESKYPQYKNDNV